LYMLKGSNYEGHHFTQIWSTLEREQTTTIVSNLPQNITTTYLIQIPVCSIHCILGMLIGLEKLLF